MAQGLPTPENWCYASSVFQAFLHAPTFVDWLEQEHQSCVVESCLACALRVLSLSYWRIPLDWPSFEAAHTDLTRTLRQSPTHDLAWNWGSQQDALEFYQRLLAALKAGGPEIRLAIEDLFHFDVINTMTCPNCGNEESTAEPNTSLLHVNFENGAPLEDILRNITFGRSIYQDRHCAKCYKFLDTPNILRLVKGPDILVMHLARFARWNESTSGKNNDVIPFSEELDLSPYTLDNFALKYRLLSVVQHRGTRAAGHYINIAKGRSGQWVVFDDDKVSHAIGTDPFCPRNEAAFTPYVLFWAKEYENVGVNSPTTDEKVSTDDDDNDDDDDEMRPVQIRINGILQPPSEIFFFKKSALAKLKQQHENIEIANLEEEILELEVDLELKALEREKREKEKREKLEKELEALEREKREKEKETKRAEEEKKRKREMRKEEGKHVSKPLKKRCSKRIEKKKEHEREIERKKKEKDRIQKKEDEKEKERKKKEKQRIQKKKDDEKEKEKKEKEKERIQKKKEDEKEKEKKEKGKEKIQKQKEKEKDKEHEEQKKGVSKKRKRIDENNLPTSKMTTRSALKKQKALDDESSNGKVEHKKRQTDSTKSKK